MGIAQPMDQPLKEGNRLIGEHDIAAPAGFGRMNEQRAGPVVEIRWPQFPKFARAAARKKRPQDQPPQIERRGGEKRLDFFVAENAFARLSRIPVGPQATPGGIVRDFAVPPGHIESRLQNDQDRIGAALQQTVGLAIIHGQTLIVGAPQKVRRSLGADRKAVEPIAKPVDVEVVARDGGQIANDIGIDIRQYVFIALPAPGGLLSVR